MQSVGQEASQNTLSWTIRPRIPSIIQGSKEVSLSLFVLGTVWLLLERVLQLLVELFLFVWEFCFLVGLY